MKIDQDLLRAMNEGSQAGVDGADYPRQPLLLHVRDVGRMGASATWLTMTGKLGEMVRIVGFSSRGLVGKSANGYPQFRWRVSCVPCTQGHDIWRAAAQQRRATLTGAVRVPARFARLRMSADARNKKGSTDDLSPLQPRRAPSAAPRDLQVKYAGPCACCGVTIPAGALATYYPPGSIAGRASAAIAHLGGLDGNSATHARRTCAPEPSTPILRRRCRPALRRRLRRHLRRLKPERRRSGAPPGRARLGDRR